jgi:Glyoxalase/Bleomycin resistance protein/Dioxygenase superfamily
MPNVSPGGMAVDLQLGNGPQCLDLGSAGSNAPNINHICLAVDNFDVNRLQNILAQHGFTQSEAPEPMRMYMRTAKDCTPQLFFRDPDGILIQLQDAHYSCGIGPLGNTCPKPEPSPKKGLIPLRDWSVPTLRPTRRGPVSFIKTYLVSGFRHTKDRTLRRSMSVRAVTRSSLKQD